MESHGFTPAPVAQRIRASDYGSEGREFESLQARRKLPLRQFFFVESAAGITSVSYAGSKNR